MHVRTDELISVDRIERYEAQRTMVKTTMDATSFFGVPGVRISPAGESRAVYAYRPVADTPLEFDETTLVVVADFSGDVGGEIFGVSKVKCVCSLRAAIDPRD